MLQLKFKLLNMINPVLVLSSFILSKTALSAVTFTEKSSYEENNNFFIEPYYYRFTLGDLPFSGVGIAAGIERYANEKFGIQAVMEQTFSFAGNLQSSITNIKLGGVYALTGKLKNKSVSYDLNHDQFYQSSPAENSGARLYTGLCHLSLNGSTSSLPLTGMSFGIGYAFKKILNTEPTLGAEVQHASNSDVKINVLKLKFAFNFLF